jgi:hypothetical protein
MREIVEVTAAILEKDARGEFHLSIDHLIDCFNQTDLPGILFDNGYMPGIGECHLIGVDCLHLPSLGLGLNA